MKDCQKTPCPRLGAACLKLTNIQRGARYGRLLKSDVELMMSLNSDHEGDQGKGGGNWNAGGARPLDLAHLFRQTMGDRTLEAEILSLFSKQLAPALESFKKANGLERKQLAHTLKGTGRSVGAFAIADIAERMERAPFDRTLLAELDDRIAETRDFIASLCR